jgi:hypothetical protein
MFGSRYEFLAASMIACGSPIPGLNPARYRITREGVRWHRSRSGKY